MANNINQFKFPSNLTFTATGQIKSPQKTFSAILQNFFLKDNVLLLFSHSRHPEASSKAHTPALRHHQLITRAPPERTFKRVIYEIRKNRMYSNYEG